MYTSRPASAGLPAGEPSTPSASPRRASLSLARGGAGHVVGFLARNLDDRHAESLEQLVDARELRREVVRQLLARRLVVGETLVAEGPLARVEHHPQVVGLPLV